MPPGPADRGVVLGGAMDTDGSWVTRAVSAADAVSAISSGMRVFLHGAAATPTPLIEALAARRDLEGVTLYLSLIHI